jgi:hypothetical protein
VAGPDKDDFNLDDFQYSGVKLTPLPDFTETASSIGSLAPAADPLAAPLAAEAAPEDKKGKKKAKKEKPAKVKKVKPVAVVVESDRVQSPFLKKLSQASPFTVLLGLTVLALLLAVIFLFIELGRYDLNIKAIAPNTSMSASFDGPGVSGIERGSSRLSELA